MRTLLVLVVAGALATAAALGAVAMGLPDVAATTPHWGVTEWVLHTAMERGVERRAAGIDVPGDLDDPARARAGAAAYDHMCAICHAAPGVEAHELAEGLLPEPPELEDEAEEWGPAELFWITKHGIKMTGMPAFGPTHSEREIWDVVAFLGRLPGLSAQEYRALLDGAGVDPEVDPGEDPGAEHGRGPR